MSFDFIFNFFLLHLKKIYTLKLSVALNFSLLRHDSCFKSFFPSLREGYTEIFLSDYFMKY